jgi:DNA-directed RNA polymerase specialized sigma24 family protein
MYEKILEETKIENFYKPTLKDFLKFSKEILNSLSSSNYYEYNLLKDAIQESYFEFLKNQINNVNYTDEKSFRTYLKKIIKNKYLNLIFKVGKKNNKENLDKTTVEIFGKYNDLIDFEDVTIEESLTDYLNLLDENNPEKILIFKEFEDWLKKEKNKVLYDIYKGYNTNEIKENYNFSSQKVVHSLISRLRLRFKSHFQINRKTIHNFTYSYERKDIQGKNNIFSKLNENEVLNIKKLINLGLSDKEIANKLNNKVMKSTINKIRNNIIWKHIKV